MLRKLAEPARSCFLPPCRVCSPVRVYFHVSQVRRAFLLVLLATVPAEPAGSSLLRPYWVCSPVRAYFHASQVRGVCWIVPHVTLSGPLTRARLLSCFTSSPTQLARAFATLPGLLIGASLFSCFASSLSLLGHATCNLTGSSHPCGFTFMVRKFADGSCNLAESASPCEITFILRKFAESARSCFLRPWRVCLPVRVYFLSSQVR
ncbi:hypothetical protein CRG98_049928 [Punica granatum]|uniref:Uncharacterized protein n=1 Tax=Punica granatum TaxID=22663 RepID=A0A2I0H1K5_PUNGR|nr:hypothetical protein CRG98_049928 [Punica granatum]